MFSTEFRYKLNNLRRILKKATVQLIRILFILASVATIVLMAYEYGYAISEAGKRYVTEGFNIIIRIFFFGSIATIFLDPKEIWQEKGYWIEIIVLALLLFVILTQTPAHFPTDNWLQKTDHILTHILLLFISIIHLSKVVVTGLQRHIRPEMTFVYSFLAIILTESASWIAEFYRCPVHFYECRVYYGPDGCRYGHHFYYNRSGGSPFADPNRRDRGHDFHQFYRFVFFHPNLF